MPEIDGLSLLSDIRSEPALEKLRVAVISADRDPEKIRALARLQIDAYLLKPVDAAKLRAALRAVT
jgi:two-component system chemotaxis response regulator CheY